MSVDGPEAVKRLFDAALEAAREVARSIERRVEQAQGLPPEKPPADAEEGTPDGPAPRMPEG